MDVIVLWCHVESYGGTTVSHCQTNIVRRECIDNHDWDIDVRLDARAV